MNITFEQVLQLLQTLSIVCAILVAFGTLKGRGDDKTKDMIEIKTDLKYIKALVDKIPNQDTQLALLRRDIDTLGKRLEEHICAPRNREEGQ